MRRVVGLLHDAEDAAPDVMGARELDQLVARFNRQGPPVELTVPDTRSTWPPEVNSTVYRVVQEALTNVTKHAPHADGVDVTIVQGPSAVTVEVVDDAPPSPARVPVRGGYGIIGMRERVETLGGTLRAGPRPESGWSVRATLPLDDGRSP